MRTRKNPGLRQEAFLRAATALFLEKGYDGVSIREILDAVADNSSSPSVFYYYFPSKEELYRACNERVTREYLSAIESAFNADVADEKERVLLLASYIEKYVMRGKRLISPGSSTGNRLYVLDLREQVVRRISELWEKLLAEKYRMPEKDVAFTAKYLAGGVGELIMFFLLEETNCPQSTFEAYGEAAVRLTMNAIGLPPDSVSEMTEAFRTRKFRDPV